MKSVIVLSRNTFFVFLANLMNESMSVESVNRFFWSKLKEEKQSKVFFAFCRASDLTTHNSAETSELSTMEQTGTTVSLDTSDWRSINVSFQLEDDVFLPSGWERFEGKPSVVLQPEWSRLCLLDEQGVYYWQKRTGTVTRERPELTLDSPSSTLSSSSSTDICFETNALLYKSESNASIKVIDSFLAFEWLDQLSFVA